MGRFIATRLLQFPLILAIIYLTTFFLVWIAPGDPFTRTDKKVNEAVIKATKERLHAQSWYQFLGHYPVMMLKGDLGPSLTYEEWSVTKIVGDALPVSVTLGVFAMTVAVIVGVGIGALAAVRRGGPFDWFSLSVALVGISLPSFVSASVLFAIFCSQFKIFPIG
ncbi:MAG: oligopeptide transporter permease OppB, partial [Phycisphaerales bacterium]|nr:oligopeptide transporter permease OppB [Phycisphaerales bacterium]